MSAGEGTLEQTPQGSRLRFERLLEHPPEVVWRALTEPAELRAWFPQELLVERWAQGARLRFEHPGVPEASFEGTVLVWDPPHTLEYSWGPDVLRFELAPAGAGTKLTLLDTLQTVGKAARDGAGWHVCLESLANALAGIEPAREGSERWREVHPSYVERFGPAAATVRPPAGALD